MEERCIAARRRRRRARRPLRIEVLAPARQLGVVDEKIEAPAGGIEADRVTVADQRQGPAERRFRRHVQDDLDTTGAMLGPLVAFAIFGALADGFDVVFVASFCGIGR